VIIDIYYLKSFVERRGFDGEEAFIQIVLFALECVGIRTASLTPVRLPSWWTEAITTGKVCWGTGQIVMGLLKSFFSLWYLSTYLVVIWCCISCVLYIRGGIGVKSLFSLLHTSSSKILHNVLSSLYSHLIFWYFYLNNYVSIYFDILISSTLVRRGFEYISRKKKDILFFNSYLSFFFQHD